MSASEYYNGQRLDRASMKWKSRTDLPKGHLGLVADDGTSVILRRMHPMNAEKGVIVRELFNSRRDQQPIEFATNREFADELQKRGLPTIRHLRRTLNQIKHP